MKKAEDMLDEFFNLLVHKMRNSLLPPLTIKLTKGAKNFKNIIDMTKPIKQQLLNNNMETKQERDQAIKDLADRLEWERVEAIRIDIIEKKEKEENERKREEEFAKRKNI